MRLSRILAALAVFAATQATAQPAGVAVQVSNGKKVPTVQQLTRVLNQGDFVRDILGWHKADQFCNLRSNPNTPIDIPGPMLTLYRNVAAAGQKNFVTLGFNNKHCGMRSNAGGVTFPMTPELRAEFAAYAVRVVRQVPGLGGISIWNELSGTWDGGFTSRAAKLTNYCLLANQVINQVRSVNPTIPIAIGATVGGNVTDWFVEMFHIYGCIGRNDPNIWLDVHPYLSSDGEFNAWNHEIDRLRSSGIGNPLVATEWGAKAGQTWRLAHPAGNYASTFANQVLAGDANWAGTMWYEMLYDKRTPNASLFDTTGVNLSIAGQQYLEAFKQ